MEGTLWSCGDVCALNGLHSACTCCVRCTYIVLSIAFGSSPQKKAPVWAYGCEGTPHSKTRVHAHDRVKWNTIPQSLATSQSEGSSDPEFGPSALNTPRLEVAKTQRSS